VGDQVKPAQGHRLDRVRIHTAKLNLMRMKKGDRVFFYHSNVGKEIRRHREVVREHIPTRPDKTDTFVVLDIKAWRR